MPAPPAALGEIWKSIGSASAAGPGSPSTTNSCVSESARAKDPRSTVRPMVYVMLMYSPWYVSKSSLPWGSSVNEKGISVVPTAIVPGGRTSTRFEKTISGWSADGGSTPCVLGVLASSTCPVTFSRSPLWLQPPLATTRTWPSTVLPGR